MADTSLNKLVAECQQILEQLQMLPGQEAIVAYKPEVKKRLRDFIKKHGAEPFSQAFAALCFPPDILAQLDAELLKALFFGFSDLEDLSSVIAATKHPNLQNTQFIENRRQAILHIGGRILGGGLNPAEGFLTYLDTLRTSLPQESFRLEEFFDDTIIYLRLESILRSNQERITALRYHSDEENVSAISFFLFKKLYKNLRAVNEDWGRDLVQLASKKNIEFFFSDDIQQPRVLHFPALYHHCTPQQLKNILAELLRLEDFAGYLEVLSQLDPDKSAHGPSHLQHISPDFLKLVIIEVERTDTSTAIVFLANLNAKLQKFPALFAVYDEHILPLLCQSDQTLLFLTSSLGEIAEPASLACKVLKYCQEEGIIDFTDSTKSDAGSDYTIVQDFFRDMPKPALKEFVDGLLIALPDQVFPIAFHCADSGIEELENHVTRNHVAAAFRNSPTDRARFELVDQALLFIPRLNKFHDCISGEMLRAAIDNGSVDFSELSPDEIRTCLQHDDWRKVLRKTDFDFLKPQSKANDNQALAKKFYKLLKPYPYLSPWSAAEPPYPKPARRRLTTYPALKDSVIYRPCPELSR